MDFPFKSTILKQFDGVTNYFNPSAYNNRIILRKEYKYENKVLISDIVDMNDNVILKHKIENGILYSYEDARFISDNEISVCVCKRDMIDLAKILGVECKKYNIVSTEFTHYKTQNAHFEKNWQFYEDKIIYHVDPYTILDSSEKVIHKTPIKWDRWKHSYGNPSLSTNVFTVDEKKYILFHSYIVIGRLEYKYFVGILRLNDMLEPIGYYNDPIFTASREMSDNTVLQSLWNWRNTELCNAVKHEVIFPMNVTVTDTQLEIYCGINDCSANILYIDIQEFIDKISDQTFILSI